MPAKKSRMQEHVHYHEDGTVWAKGQTISGVPTGYWEWFRKDGTRLSRTANKSAIGRRTTRTVTCTR